MGLLNRFMSMLPLLRGHKGTRDDNSDGGEEVGHAGPDLPEEIWHHLCSKLPMRDAARAACVSRVFLSSWGRHPDLTFTHATVFTKEKIRKWAGDWNNERYRRDYNRIIDRIMATRRCANVKTFRLHFHGPCNTKSYDRLDTWLQIAVTPVLEELTLYMWSAKTKYNFPCSLLSDGIGNTIRHLCLGNCILRPTVDLSLTCLTELYLNTVCIAENELGRLLSSSFALETLVLKHCDDITRLEIPCHLQRLSCLEVFECYRLEAIENKAPNLSSFDFTGYERVQLSLGKLSQAKSLRLNPICVINYAIDKLASSVPNLETLILSSSREIVDAPIIPTSKFFHLKILVIHFRNWTYGREYDFLSLVSFLDASPSLETFSLSVSVQSQYNLIVGDPSTLRQMPERHHDKLKTVCITGFCRQKSLVELTRHILESATSLKHLKLTTIDPKYRFFGHNRFSKCPTLDKEYIRELWESITAVKTYIEGKVPSTVKLEVIGKPCIRCHGL